MALDAAALLDQIDDLPPLPAVAARVLGMADDDRTSAMDMAQVLSTDQALTAKLIRVSNSAYYGFARRVSTVREAVVMLGFKHVRQVAVGCGYVVAGAALQELPSDLVEIEAACGGIERVLERAHSLIECASGTPEKWFAAA